MQPIFTDISRETMERFMMVYDGVLYTIINLFCAKNIYLLTFINVKNLDITKNWCIFVM